MEVTQTFKKLLENRDYDSGNWLDREEKEGTLPCKFTEVSTNRGRLVYVGNASQVHNPINYDEVKKEAVKKLYGQISPKLWKLFPKMSIMPKLSHDELMYLINSYEEIREKLIEEKHSEYNTRGIFRRIQKTLAGRNFNPETLEFDLEKQDEPDPAIEEVQKQLAKYRSNPSPNDHQTSIQFVELSTRAYNRLKDYDIRTIEELAHVKTSLYQTKGVGFVLKNELEGIVKAVGTLPR